jgi:hypothetical protein
MSKIQRNCEPTRSRRRTNTCVAVTGGIILSALFLATPLQAQYGRDQSRRQNQVPNPATLPQSSPDLTPKRTEKQKEALVKYNFKEMQKHADQLAELAQSLQKKIGESNVNELSLEVVRKAEEIEKLAKKIKNEAKGI